MDTGVIKVNLVYNVVCYSLWSSLSQPPRILFSLFRGYSLTLAHVRICVKQLVSFAAQIDHVVERQIK